MNLKLVRTSTFGKAGVWECWITHGVLFGSLEVFWQRREIGSQPSTLQMPKEPEQLNLGVLSGLSRKGVILHKVLI